MSVKRYNYRFDVCFILINFSNEVLKDDFFLWKNNNLEILIDGFKNWIKGIICGDILIVEYGVIKNKLMLV